MNSAEHFSDAGDITSETVAVRAESAPDWQPDGLDALDALGHPDGSDAPPTLQQRLAESHPSIAQAMSQDGLTFGEALEHYPKPDDWAPQDHDFATRLARIARHVVTDGDELVVGPDDADGQLAAAQRDGRLVVATDSGPDQTDHPHIVTLLGNDEETGEALVALHGVDRADYNREAQRMPLSLATELLPWWSVESAAGR